MSRLRARRREADAGFTLLEALAAIALMGLIVGALATVTAQWMPSWNRSHIRTQRNEQVAIALDRLVADLSAAEYVSPNRVVNAPLFRGAEFAIIFVRSAVGPNSRPGLEIVQIAETVDKSGPALVRTRAPFVPLATGDPMVDPIPFADPVVLLRAPLRIAFAYAGPDGVWGNSWGNSSRKLGNLPAAVRFEIRDGEAGPVVSTATRVHAELRPPPPAQNDVAPPGAAQPQPNNAETAK
jgi:general secretion pathway protein J